MKIRFAIYILMVYILLAGCQNRPDPFIGNWSGEVTSWGMAKMKINADHTAETSYDYIENGKLINTFETNLPYHWTWANVGNTITFQSKGSTPFDMVWSISEDGKSLTTYPVFNAGKKGVTTIFQRLP